MQPSSSSPELGAALEQARIRLTQQGIAAAPRVLAMLAQAPGIESNEPAQAVLTDVIAAALDGCEKGELAAVISALADCPPALANVALTLLTAAFFPDGKIVPAAFDDSAALCFSLFVSVAGKPLEALELIDLMMKDRKGERFVANAAMLRAHVQAAASKVGTPGSADATANRSPSVPMPGAYRRS